MRWLNIDGHRQPCEGQRSGDPVDAQAAISLKTLHGLLGERAVTAIEWARWVARAGQQTLHLPHEPRAARLVPGARVERNLAPHQRCQGARSGDPVDLQAPVSLKAPNRLLGERAVGAVDWARSVPSPRQQALRLPHQAGAAQRVPLARVDRKAGRLQRF
jgi:hypothetical protein